MSFSTKRPVVDLAQRFPRKNRKIQPIHRFQTLALIGFDFEILLQIVYLQYFFHDILGYSTPSQQQME